MNAQNLELRRNERVGLDSFKNTERDPSTGFLRGKAIAAIVGVHPYPQPDGSCRWEYISAEELFSPGTIDSCKRIPVVVDHPELRRRADGSIDPKYNGLVNAESAAEQVVGSTGDDITHDNRHLFIPFSVYRKDGIEAIESGKVEISMGYRYLLIEQPGEFEGVKYTHVKRNVRYNHFAIVDNARVGPKARINIDASGAPINEVLELAFDNASPVSENVKKENHRMEQLTRSLKNIPYKADPEVWNALDEANAAIATDSAKQASAFDAMKKRAETAEASVATLTTERDGLKKDMDELPEKVRKEMDSWDKTVKKAAFHLGTKAEDCVKDSGVDDGDELGLMKATLKKKKPDTDWENADEKYVRGSFDMLPDEDESGTAGDDSAAKLSPVAAQRAQLAGGRPNQAADRSQDDKPRGRDKFLSRIRGGKVAA